MSRRMFSEDIVTSDAFLDMPHDAQLLYFMLNMHADDDGFVANPKSIKRMCGASDDAAKILVSKKFLLMFHSGLCVIKHWRMHNQIRKDRYTETKYTAEKSKLFIRKIGTYSFNKTGAIPVPSGHFSLVDKHWLPVRQPRLGKDSIVKNNKGGAEVKTPTWLDKETWSEWVQYRKEIKKKLTPTSIKRQLALLENNKKDHKKIIIQSIRNGWTGLFPLKDVSQTPQTGSRSDKARAYDKRLEAEEEDRYRSENEAHNEALKGVKELTAKFKIS
jgi:hypothetical protein